MSFADTMKRADDHPNAFKLARRMIESWSKDSINYTKPEKASQGYIYSVTHDGSPTAKVAIALIEAALQKSCGGKYADCLFHNYHESCTEARVCLPQLVNGNPNLPTYGPEFPVKEVLRQLDTLQHQLGSNWFKDNDGNYRHVKVFEHMERQGYDPDLNRLDKRRLKPELLVELITDSTQCSQNEQDKMQLICGFKNGAKKPIKELPVDDPKLKLRGYTVGLCLTPEQVDILAKEIGFLKPARSKSAA